jgi:hypothetical protein
MVFFEKIRIKISFYFPATRVRMNCEEFVVPLLELSLAVLKDSLRCILHTILFSRSLGGEVAVEPATFKSELLGISYCRANHAGDTGPDIGQIVENKIREFALKLQDSGSLTLVLAFYVPRHSAASRKTLWDILSQPFDDRAVFERWKIQIDTRSDADDARAITSAASQTKDRVFHIIKRVNERSDHLPPPPADQPWYHFEISFEPSAAVRANGVPPSMWSPKAIAQSIRSIPFIT